MTEDAEMTRYYFHVTDGVSNYADTEGSFQPSLAQARSEARRIAAELSRDEEARAGFVVCAVDDSGNEIATVPIDMQAAADGNGEIQHLPTSGHNQLHGAASPITLLPIRLIQGAAFDPDAIKLLSEAYEKACGILGDAQPVPVREVLATRILAAARRGVRDVRQLASFALEGVKPGSDAV
jgi:hypothetical protein